MEFNPNNPIIQLCLQGMAMEEAGKSEEAANLFLQAWNKAGNDLEKFYPSYFLARHQTEAADRLKWLETALELAREINNESVSAAFPSLYSNIARSYEEMGEAEKAKQNRELAASFTGTPTDNGPFYHGTKADLQVGDLLTAGANSNYDPSLTMNHIYFTALVNGAGLAAALAQGEGRERVYIVEPTGSFENDPNVTDKKFPGNPTRSYRSKAPLKIIGEVEEWARQTTGQVQKWREKLASNKGEIIN